MLNYKFKPHPSKIMERTLLKHLELCRWLNNSLLDGFNFLRNYNLDSKISNASWRKLLCMLSYKAERAGKVVVKVNSRVKPEGLSCNNPYRGYISVFRIRMGGSPQ